MYSVIILNRKAIDSFNRHYPLFLGALDDGEFGICRWNETGTTVETALPELCEMINGKEEWRAIIVHTEDEACMADYPACPRNPFDFIINRDADTTVKDSPIPLVKLTYILGGVPAPIKQFKETVLTEKVPPCVIYSPVDNEEEEAEHERLSEKYHYDGRKPVEIMLLRLREQADTTETRSKRSWDNSIETKSSDFWKRNRYPSSCRFLVFERTQQGDAERAAEAFRFWTSVLLLAVNGIPSDCLQAYRLYMLDVDIDTETLRECIQDMVNRLAGARAALEESLRIEMHKRLQEKRDIPDYRVSVPVTFDFSNRPLRKNRPKRIRLTAKSHKSELLRWEDTKNAIEADVTAAFHSTVRILEQSAERFHGISDYSSKDIRRLDKYEILDMEESLDKTYQSMMKLLEKLPREPMYNQSEVLEASDAVNDRIRDRLTLKQTLLSLGMAAFLWILSLVPAFYFLHTQPNGDVRVFLAAVGLGLVLFSLVVLGFLLFKRYKLKKAIKAYVKLLRRALGRLYASAQDFSGYMGHIASHVRGSGYLNQLQRKNFDSQILVEASKKHIHASNALVGKLKDWSLSFHIRINFDEDAIEDGVIIDPLCPPGQNRLYTFESAEESKALLNRSGDYVKAPFAFIKQLKIVREELYNDD